MPVWDPAPWVLQFLRKKWPAAGLSGIEVIHTPVSSIPADVQIVVTHQELGERAAHSNPNAELVLITNFLAAPEYEQLLETIKREIHKPGPFWTASKPQNI